MSSDDGGRKDAENMGPAPAPATVMAWCWCASLGLRKKTPRAVGTTTAPGVTYQLIVIGLMNACLEKEQQSSMIHFLELAWFVSLLVLVTEFLYNYSITSHRQPATTQAFKKV
jgi:hypothetical protein